MDRMGQFKYNFYMKKIGKKLIKGLASTFLGSIVILGGYYLLLMLMNGVNGDHEDEKISEGSEKFKKDDLNRDDPKNPSRYRIDGISKRQSEILCMIESLGRVSISDLESSFKHVSSRTLRRDLDQLQEEGLIVQKGKTRSTVYETA